jgi:hypothetical protein
VLQELSFVTITFDVGFAADFVGPLVLFFDEASGRFVGEPPNLDFHFADQVAQFAERFTSNLKARTCGSDHVSHTIVGNSSRPSFRAAMNRRSPSTISPLPRDWIGIANPYARIDAIIRSTAWPFLRRLRP